MLRKRRLSAASLVLTASLFSFAAFAQGPPAGGGEHHGPPPKPTNLKVFPKDIDPEELMKHMHAYTHDLGVKCTFCHVGDEKTHHMNFASDAKPDKEIARTMIAMTMEINKKYLSTINDPDAKPENKVVTCGTCHRGNTMPAPFKAPPDGPQHPMGAMPKP
ncbi:c-type cytochrome [Silvibacterium acidisoli]|uniref:c-type cytochrome n=1 Tax=Acidobacteriaceae bacterium ZG23-2 TaxID=2883246 RepID=UPI00406C6544